MVKATFEAKVGRLWDELSIDPVRVAVGSFTISRGSTIKRKLDLEEGDRVKVTIERV